MNQQNNALQPSQLSGLLCSEKPPETSGSRAAAGFSYQHAWALALVLELHAQPENYVVLLDYHDDVVVADDDEQPKEIKFYQVKSKDAGSMSQKDLLRRKMVHGKVSASIVAKLYGHMRTFGDFTKLLAVVTNVPYNFKLRTGEPCSGKTRIGLKEVQDADKKAFLETLQKELSEVPAPELEELLCFLKSKLHHTEYRTHLTGVLAEFVNEYCAEKQVDPTLLCSVLMDEVRQRSSTVITPMDFGELVQAKGISRRYFKHTLEKLPSAKQFKDFETWLRAQLQAEKVNFSKIQDIVRQCQRYEVTRMDSSNTTLNQLRQTTEECLALVLAQVPRVEHLIDQLERVVLDVQAQRPMELHSYGADFCRAIAASKIYGY